MISFLILSLKCENQRIFESREMCSFKVQIFLMLLCASKLESLSYQDRSFFNLKIKSIKCIVDIPEYAKILYCYIKPISRTSSSVNIGAQSFKDFVGPSKVSLQYYLFGLSLKKLRNCVYINFIHKICIVFGVGAVQIWTHLPRNVSIQF